MRHPAEIYAEKVFSLLDHYREGVVGYRDFAEGITEAHYSYCSKRLNMRKLTAALRAFKCGHIDHVEFIILLS